MKIKEIQDSKNFTARRLRNVERAREKELRRAEYDPEGFFRPGTAASAASVVRHSSSHPLRMRRLIPLLAAGCLCFGCRLSFPCQMARPWLPLDLPAPLALCCCHFLFLFLFLFALLSLVTGSSLSRSLGEHALQFFFAHHGRCFLQGSAKSASSAGSVGSLGKDAWDRYTVDELRDDVLDFCRGDFEFESTEV